MQYFESERLIFRDWTLQDKIDFRKMNGDPQVMEFFVKPLSEEESDALYERIVDEIRELGFGLYAVETKAGQNFIGFIGFSRVTYEADFTPCIEIGWRLNQASWGKGYATEGAKTCLDYAAKNLDLDLIHSMTAQLNIRSQNVMRKIGMTKDRDFLHPRIPSGNPLKEHVLYSYYLKSSK